MAGKANPTGWIRVPNGGTPEQPTVYTAIREALQESADSIRALQSQVDGIRPSIGEVGSGASLGGLSGLSIGSGGGSGGGGSVTSVDLTAPSEFSVSGNPVTIAGTLALSWVSQTANKVFASPNGSTGTPTFRSLVAADIPNLDASKITSGQLALAQGGTNADLSSTVSNGGIVYSTSTALAILSGTATAGRILRSGSSAAPTWSTATYPATTTAYQILYSSAANTIGEITTAASSVLVTNGTGVPSFATDIPTAVTIGGKYIYRADGTDVPLADGGTNASLSAVDGGVVYSTASAMAITSATDLKWDNTNKRLGIGTASPSSLLHLSSTGPVVFTIEADTDNVTETDTASILLKQDGGLTTARVGFKDDNSFEVSQVEANFLQFRTADTERMRITGTGNVGIGVTPSYVLDVAKTSTNAATAEILARSVLTMNPAGVSIANSEAISGQLVLNAGANNITSRNSAGLFKASHTGTGTVSQVDGITVDSFSKSTAGTITALSGVRINSPSVSTGTVTAAYGAYIDTQKTAQVTTGWGVYQVASGDVNAFNGKVAIGSTTAPTNALDVTGSATVSSNLTVTADLTVDTSTLKVDSANNRVGIGTSTPSYPLHVASTIAATTATNLAYSDATITPSGAANAAYIGQYSLIKDTGANVTGASSALTAIYGEAYHNGSATLTWLRGVSAGVGSNGTAGITSAAGLYVFGPAAVAAGPITTAYGVYLGAQKATNVSTGYGVYSAGASDLNTLAGKLRVGSTTDPTNALDVTGAATISTNLTVSGDLTVDSPTFKVDSTNNRVGVGTTSPSYQFDINFGAVAGTVRSAITNTDTANTSDSRFAMYNSATDAGLIMRSTGHAETSDLVMYSAANNLRFYTGGLLRATIASTGAATFTGDVTAAGDLAVNGGDITTSATTFNLLNATAATVNFAGAATALTMGAATGTAIIKNATTVLGNGDAGAAPGPGALRAPSAGVGNSNIAGGNLTISGGNSTGTGAGGEIIFQTAAAGGTGSTANTLTERLRITSAGNLTAAGDVAVNGGDITTTATTFNLVNTAATTVNFAGAATALTMGASTGTAIIKNATTVLGNGDASVAPGAGFVRAPSGTGTDITGGALTIAGGNSTGTGPGGAVVFQTAPAAGSTSNVANTLTERMRITSAGNVGIGIVSPSQVLHAVGLVRFDKSSAVAEPNIRLRSNNDAYVTEWGIGQGASSNDLAFRYFNGTSWSNGMTLSTTGGLTLTTILNGYTTSGLQLRSAVSGASASSDYFIQRGADTGVMDRIVIHTPTTAGMGVAHMTSGGTTRWFSDGNSGNFILGNGDASATPAGNALRGPSGSGNNIAGGSLTLAGGAATGNAAGGALIFQTSAVGTSGTTIQTLTERARITASGQMLVGTTTADVNSLVMTRSDTNGFTGITAYNQDAASTGAAAFLSANDGSTSISLYSLNAGYTTAGALQVSSGVLWVSKANGLNITATNASTGLVRVYAGGSASANERVRVALTKSLSDAVATTVISLTLGTNTYSGCSILYTIEANDASNYQAKTGIVHVAAVRAAGSGVTQISDSVTTAAVTTGTLTSTWTATYNAVTGAVDVQLNADTSLTPTTLRVRYVVFNNGSNAFT